MSATPDDLLEQTQWDFFWVPDDTTVSDRPELLYVSCPRDVPTLNCVTRIRGDEASLPALIGEVSRAHNQVRSRCMVRRTDTAKILEGALAAAGYSPASYTHAYAVPVDRYDPRPAAKVNVHKVSTMAGLRDCAQVIGRAFPDARVFTEAELENDLAICLRPGAQIERFVAYDVNTGEPLCFGGMSLHPTLALGLLWGGGTVPEARGRGVYSAIVAARVVRAKALGLRYVGLYAISHTSAPIVARQGFDKHGEMTYWERPALA